MVESEPVNGASGSSPLGPPAPGAGPPVGSDEERALCRDDVDSVITGVAAGLGRYTGVDPVVWRAAFAVTALAGGTGLWLYVAAWLLTRDPRGGPAMLEQLLNRRLTGSAVPALLGVGLATGVALSLVGGFGWGTLVLAVPLILGGLVAHNRGVDLAQVARDLPGWLKTGEPPPTGPHPEPVPAYYNPAQPWAAAPHGPIDLAIVGRQAAGGSASEPYGDDEKPPPPAPPGGEGLCGVPKRRGRADGGTGGRAASPARRQRGVRLFTFVFWAVAALTGATLALTEEGPLATLVGPETGPLYLGGVVSLFGAALVIGTWVGSTRGLSVFATLATLLAVAAVTVNLTALRFGDVTWRPATAAEAGEPFDLTAGHASLDLTALDLEPGQEVNVDARVGFGGMDVRVPDTARVVVHGTAVAGGIRLDDVLHRTGTRLDLREVLEPVPAAAVGADRQEAPEDAAAPPVLTVNLSTHSGALEVRRVAS
ncbi:PspC domain-containing protein [Actinorugispora endophytica]|nr:PspC domain-containing protein [Actinorugispora endophytica]